MRVKSLSISLLNLAWFLLLGLPNDMGSLTSFAQMQANGQLKVLILSTSTTSPDIKNTRLHANDMDPNNVTLELLQTFADQQAVRLDVTFQDTNTIKHPHNFDLTVIAYHEKNAPLPADLMVTDSYLTIDQYLVFRKTDRDAVAQTQNIMVTPAEPATLFNTFKAIENRQLRSAIALSYDWAPYKTFMPKLTGKNIGPAYDLKWAFYREQDQRLYQAAQDFLHQEKQSGRLAQLQEHFLMSPDQEPLISGPAFTEHVSERLQDYLPTFKSAAQRYQLDWRLLAAISYQESRWQADAVSPTGVQGLMMLTQNTAADMGIANRENPTQSIYGAARYLHTIKENLPDYITEPDRTWMALASYNIGPAHLLKAIRKTEAAGNNSGNWLHVRQQLKSVTVPNYESKQRYLRGYDQVRSYVTHVRAYYDYLSRPNLVIAANKDEDSATPMAVAFNN